MNPTDFTDENLDKVARAYEADQQRKREELIAARKQHAATAVVEANGRFDRGAFDAETERGREEFENFSRQRQSATRNQIETENGAAFVASTPTYKPTVENAATIETYLRNNHLPATVQNLQRAFEVLKPHLELNPEPVKAPPVYTEDELYAMPIDELEDVIHQNAARDRILAEGDLK